MSVSKKLLALTSLAVVLHCGNCAVYVSLIGTEASTPPMECEKNEWIHLKADGKGLDVEFFTEREIFKIKEENGGFSLVIKLSEEAAQSIHHFLGEWQCGDKTWIVKGEPYIQRLALEWDFEGKHPNSVTVNEGNAVTFVCEAYVVAEAEPEILWSIAPEDGVTDPPLVNMDNWRNSTAENMKEDGKIKENYWTSSYTLINTDGVTKEDRQNYECTVVVKDGDKDLIQSRHTLLRVKGKYASLWPAIGILIEVLLLGIGTWVYEKRKSKTDSEGPSSKAADSSAVAADQPQPSSSGAIRKRTTVNT